ncbi:MAG: glycosyltransferase family 2 protein [Sneathiella sp.]
MSCFRVSVVVPAYNSDATVCNTLDALLGQSRAADEIFIVDDHSKNPVSTVLEDRYPDIQVIRHKRNMGVQNARNTGFARVTGDYVLFLDADDILCPEFLEDTTRLLEENRDCGGCFGSFYKCFDGNSRLFLDGHKPQEPDVAEFSPKEGLSFYFRHTGEFIPSFTLLRKSALDDLCRAGYLFHPELGNNQDFHLFVRLLAKNDVLYIRNPLGVYYLQPQSISRNQEEVWSSRAVAVESLIELAEELSFSNFEIAFLRKMRATAVRRLARLLSNGGNRREAVKSLVTELRRAPSLKTFVLLLLIALGLHRRRLKYAGQEY